MCNGSRKKNQKPVRAFFNTLETKCDILDLSVDHTKSKTDKRTLQKRAKRKYLQNGLTLSLINFIEQEGEQIILSGKKSLFDLDKLVLLEKRIWKMYHCCRNVIKNGNRIHGKYCKNRLCLICNSIRQAQNLNRYKSVIQEWKDPYFVTLTIKNVHPKDLDNAITEMNTIYKRIYRAKQRKDARQGLSDQEKIMLIKKLECTYNPKFGEYHPHFHMIVRHKRDADYIMKRWLKDTTHLVTDAKGQDIKKCDENGAHELFKYFTKVFTTIPSDSVGGLKKGQKGAFLESILFMFDVMHGKRTLSGVGFKLPEVVKEEKEAIKPELSTHYEWNKTCSDWVSHTTGECLSGFIPSDSIKQLSKSYIPTTYNYEKKKNRHSGDP